MPPTTRNASKLLSKVSETSKPRNGRGKNNEDKGSPVPKVKRATKNSKANTKSKVPRNSGSNSGSSKGTRASVAQNRKPRETVVEAADRNPGPRGRKRKGDGSSSPTPKKTEAETRKERLIASYEKEVICCFPGANLEICVEDVKRLNPKVYVNDKMMDFMMHYFFTRMSDQLKDKVHIFVTYFYTCLSKFMKTQLSDSLPFAQREPINPEHEKLLNTDSVVRWTRKFDVFKKDYIVVPLFDQSHFMLLIIMNPGGAIVDTTQEISPNAPNTYMVFFDPSSGLNTDKRNHMCHCIKVWLRAAYQEYKLPGKRYAIGSNMAFDESRIEVMKPENLPIQDNMYDCGAYVWHYMEQFFCSLEGPVVLEDLPTLDWAERWPVAEKMCDLMREKAYNLVLRSSNEEGRSRLAQYERLLEVGYSREKEFMTRRCHSAQQRKHRDQNIFRRHYSLNPPFKTAVLKDPFFASPRKLAEMPLTQRVRNLRLIEEQLLMIY